MIMVIVVVISCNNKRSPGHAYMPDMAYSRGYETYARRDSSIFTMEKDYTRRGDKIFYDNMPVAGTIKTGELYPYTLLNDSNGYKMSAGIKNPIDSVTPIEMAEAGRLFNINCGICHGEKGTANGPMSSKIGAIANLTLPNFISMSDGTIFHVITYGKNNMGSYASQLNRKQRWMIVKYIRTLQGTGGAKPADSTATAKKV